MEKEKRKGARSQKEVSPDILKQLNRGLIESANLTEWLCVDHRVLITHILPLEYQKACICEIDEAQPKSNMSMIKTIGECLSVKIREKKDDKLFEKLKTHQSDSARCWAAYIIGANSQLSIIQKLNEIQHFAADLHFGVREISWMAVREDITKHLDESIAILTTWSVYSDCNIRRFSTESIRPNGVWTKKIERLKTNPEIALPILENLKSDSSKYVQDSVANWLNDASKTCPEFVIYLCQRWKKENPTKETAYITKRALRTIDR